MLDWVWLLASTAGRALGGVVEGVKGRRPSAPQSNPQATSREGERANSHRDLAYLGALVIPADVVEKAALSGEAVGVRLYQRAVLLDVSGVLLRNDDGDPKLLEIRKTILKAVEQLDRAGSTVEGVEWATYERHLRSVSSLIRDVLTARALGPGTQEALVKIDLMINKYARVISLEGSGEDTRVRPRGPATATDRKVRPALPPDIDEATDILDEVFNDLGPPPTGSTVDGYAPVGSAPGGRL